MGSGSFAAGSRRGTRTATGEGSLALLVDDVADNREIYAEMLAAMGYRVVEARNGAEGVATAIAENAACAGCAAYLVKPCLPEDLAGVVEMTLRALREAV